MIFRESDLTILGSNFESGVRINLDLEHERLLVERAKKEPAAFGELYDIYYSRIFNYVLKRTGNIHLTQDVTSEVFFNALKNIGNFRWRGISFSSWLYRIASNEIANHFRKNKGKQVSLEIILDQTDISDPSAEDELLKIEEELDKHKEFLALRSNISKLSVKYQEVIVLRFFEEKQLEEIAEILDKPVGTVKSLLHRGLEKLRMLM